MTEYMPADFEPPIRRGNGGGSSGELADAVRMARERPGAWVRLGEPRRLEKPPTSWCSEVNAGRKTIFRVGERWQATYEESGTYADRLYTKYIRLEPASTN